MKNNIFDRELQEIDNIHVRDFVRNILTVIPERFWTEPASSTGKYHPSSSLGYMGLVRHTKQVFWIAKTMRDTKMFEQANFNVVLAACLLHDAWKYYGASKFTYKNHASLAVEKIDGIVALTGCFKTLLPDGSNPDWYNLLLECIQAHNGKFTSEWTGEFNLEQKLVHLADMLASRPFLNFEENKCPK